MLGDKRLYATPDDTVETWCLLVVETTSKDGITHVTGWHIGRGNSHQLTYTESMSRDSPQDETQVLDSLLDELHPLRREGLVLIAPSHRTLCLLRTRLLISDLDGTTLRGFSYFSIEELLDRYFRPSPNYSERELEMEEFSIDYPFDWRTIADQDETIHRTPVSKLWSAVTQIGPLVPLEALGGRPI